MARKRGLWKSRDRRRDAQVGWYPGDSWNVAMDEQRRMLADLVAIIDRLKGVRRAPRGKPAADARKVAALAAADAAARASEPPPRRYTFQSPFGRAPAAPLEPPGRAGAPLGNTNALKHGRRSRATKAARHRRLQAKRDLAALQRRLVQVERDWSPASEDT